MQQIMHSFKWMKTKWKKTHLSILIQGDLFPKDGFNRSIDATQSFANGKPSFGTLMNMLMFPRTTTETEPFLGFDSLSPNLKVQFLLILKELSLMATCIPFPGSTETVGAFRFMSDIWLLLTSIF